MVLVRTPYRISLFGGGTDYPAWTRSHVGQVLSTTINKFCWLLVRRLPPYQPYNFRVVYSKMEHVLKREDIQHPAVRACLEYVGVEDVAVIHDGDLPARSGMGSSSAFTVGLLHALHALKGQHVDRDRLAREAIHVEQTMLKEDVGAQDQVAVARGGFNRITFMPHSSPLAQPVPVDPEVLDDLQSRLYLIYLGQRPEGVTASDIGGAYDFEAKRPHLRTMTAMVDEAVDALSRDDVDAIGPLLHDSWRLKRELGGVSDPEIDRTYEAARAGGATGGKRLGAGRGGFLRLYVPPSNRDFADVVVAASAGRPERMLVPFKFEREGSTLVHYAP